MQIAMKNGLLDSDVINGAMLQFTDGWLVVISLMDEELDSIFNEKFGMLSEKSLIYSVIFMYSVIIQ